jgi:hypothetical protein
METEEDLEEEASSDYYGQKRCIECGQWGYPIDRNRAYMCSECLKSWI